MRGIRKPQSEPEVEQIIQICNQSANSQKYSEQHGIAECGLDVFRKLTLTQYANFSRNCSKNAGLMIYIALPIN